MCRQLILERRPRISAGDAVSDERIWVERSSRRNLCFVQSCRMCDLSSVLIIKDLSGMHSAVSWTA